MEDGGGRRSEYRVMVLGSAATGGCKLGIGGIRGLGGDYVIRRHFVWGEAESPSALQLDLRPVHAKPIHLHDGGDEAR